MYKNNMDGQTPDFLCISNRKLFQGDRDEYLARLAQIDGLEISVVLREKDLPEDEYIDLAREVISRCKNAILHTYISAAASLGYKKIHLTMDLLRNSDISGFELVGASAHTVEDAVEAERLGASYITLSHIFETDCKKGVPPKGLSLIKDARKKVNIPIYALGGIDGENIGSVFAAGASGAALMSEFMRGENVSEWILNMRTRIRQ